MGEFLLLHRRAESAEPHLGKIAGIYLFPLTWLVVVVLAAALCRPAVAVRLAATALVMSGTDEILSVGPNTPVFIRDYVTAADRDFIAPSGSCVGGQSGCALVAVYTPEELRPLTGLRDMTFDASVAAGLDNLDDCVRGRDCTATVAPYTATAVQTVRDSSLVIQGRSQSAVIASFAKRDLIADPTSDTVSVILVSNPARPNGGVLARLPGLYVPILGITFSGATPTDSSRTKPLLTTDIARQYDAWDDFPTNPLNVLADLNAALGAYYLHPQNLYADGPAQLQGYYQDTTYYMAPSTLLPLLIPLSQIPIIGLPAAKALDAPLRVLVETGYNRTINPGQPSPAQFLYFPNPIATLVNLAVAVPTGWDDAISFVSGDPANRPFGTKSPGLYGVGGPPVYAGAVDPYGAVDVPSSLPADASRCARLRATTAAPPRQSRSEAGKTPHASRLPSKTSGLHQDSDRVAVGMLKSVNPGLDVLKGHDATDRTREVQPAQ